jgi:hypothetical protein
MFDRFKSQARREREAIRDAVIEAIVKSEAAAKAEIHLLETAVTSRRCGTKAMTRLVNVLLGCERTEKDAAIWQARADSLKARGHLHDALGANLGTRLVACGVLLLHLEGKEAKAAAIPSPALEALLSRSSPATAASRGPSPTSITSRSRSTAGERAAAQRRRGAGEHAARDDDDGVRVRRRCRPSLSRAAHDAAATRAAPPRRSRATRSGPATRCRTAARRPGSQCSAGPAMWKSAAAAPLPESLGRTPLYAGSSASSPRPGQ